MSQITLKEKLKQSLLAVGMITLAVGMSACRTTVTTSDPYYRAWYDVYGNYCGSGYPTSGCNFYANGYKIIDSEDPYYSSSNILYYDIWTYTNSYGYSESYLGYAWLSNTGILYDEFGNALNETQDSSADIDVLSAAASKEKQAIQAVGKAFASKYALAEDKGVQISKTLQDWAKLGMDRARTVEDTADFGKRLFGVDPLKAQAQIAKAAVSQSSSDLDELNIDVAANWGIKDPEVSKQILKTWFKNQLNEMGIQ
jgi:hypothetical protein